MNVASTTGDCAMIRTLRAAALAFGLALLSTPSVAFMHSMMGMGESDMYNLTVGGLAGRDDAKGIDEELRQIEDVEKVHVDFDNGMVMVWMKQGETLDKVLAEKIVKGAGFVLDDFERPK